MLKEIAKLFAMGLIFVTLGWMILWAFAWGIDKHPGDTNSAVLYIKGEKNYWLAGHVLATIAAYITVHAVISELSSPANVIYYTSEDGKTWNSTTKP